MTVSTASSSRRPLRQTRAASADFFLIQRWHDAWLAFEAPPGSEAVRVLPATEVWHPETLAA